MARKNEYEMTFCKQESCFYLFEEINDINRLFGEVQNRYPKYKNYLYLISGNLNYKKRITIKLDDGKLFFCQSKKERISKIEDELQHYYEYADKEKKWHDIDGLSRMNNLFSNDNYYIYFSDKEKIKYKKQGITIKVDNTFFIDMVNMKIMKRVQYIEIESFKSGNVLNFAVPFGQMMEEVYGFSKINLEMSKLEICKSIQGCSMPNQLENYNKFFISIFDFMYSSFIGM